MYFTQTIHVQNKKLKKKISKVYMGTSPGSPRAGKINTEKPYLHLYIIRIYYNTNVFKLITEIQYTDF